MSILREKDEPLFMSGESAKADALRSIATAYTDGVKIEFIVECGVFRDRR